MIEPSRRGFITGLISLVAAPAIVRTGILMPIKGIPLDWREVVRSCPPIEYDEVRCYTVNDQNDPWRDEGAVLVLREDKQHD